MRCLRLSFGVRSVSQFFGLPQRLLQRGSSALSCNNGRHLDQGQRRQPAHRCSAPVGEGAKRSRTASLAAVVRARRISFV